MITHKLTQGTPEWHAFRSKHFAASDAPAMMGVCPHKTRSQLLREKATGIVPEVSAHQQRIFDDGHRFEALARPLAEGITGVELFPAVGSDGKFLASFDGIDLLEEVIFEHKTLNAKLDVLADSEPLPIHYQIQVQHQLMVSGASKCLFMATRWDEQDALVGKVFTRWFEKDAELQHKIVAGWEQFGKDLDAWKEPEAAAPAPAGVSPDALPALHIELVGSVSSSNLPAFKARAVEVFRGINRELKTDEDFASAEKTVKWCKDIETRLDDAKRSALAQTSSIDDLFGAIDEIAAEARKTRLQLDKLVKERKAEVKAALVKSVTQAFELHIKGLEAELPAWAKVRIAPDLAGDIAGLKSIVSIKDRLDTSLAFYKVAADEEAKRLRANAKFIESEIIGYEMLFPDLSNIGCRDHDDVVSAIKSRINAFELRKKEEAEAKEELEAAIEREDAERAEAQAAEAEAEAEAEKEMIERGTEAWADVKAATEWVDDLRGGDDAELTEPDMPLSELRRRLGFSVDEAFMLGIGFEAKKVKTSRMYHSQDFGRICEAIIAHIKTLGAQ